jgi:hypothetical protein
MIVPSDDYPNLPMLICYEVVVKRHMIKLRFINKMISNVGTQRVLSDMSIDQQFWTPQDVYGVLKSL